MACMANINTGADTGAVKQLDTHTGGGGGRRGALRPDPRRPVRLPGPELRQPLLRARRRQPGRRGPRLLALGTAADRARSAGGDQAAGARRAGVISPPGGYPAPSVYYVGR